MKDLFKEIRTSQLAKHILVVLDCCYSGHASGIPRNMWPEVWTWDNKKTKQTSSEPLGSEEEGNLLILRHSLIEYPPEDEKMGDSSYLRSACFYLIASAFEKSGEDVGHGCLTKRLVQ